MIRQERLRIATRGPTALVAAATVAAAIVLTACAATPAATPEPSPTPTLAPGASPAACADSDLDATITKWTSAADSRIATIVVKDVGGNACELGAPTAEQLLDGLGQVPITSTGDKAVGSDMALASDKAAQLNVQVTNWCTATPPDKVSIGVTLATGTSIVAEPGKNVTFAPPACGAAKKPTTLGLQSKGWSAATADTPRDAFSPAAAAA